MRLFYIKSCTACHQAQQLLTNKGFRFEYIEAVEDMGMLPLLVVDGREYRGLGRINRFVREGY